MQSNLSGGPTTHPKKSIADAPLKLRDPDHMVESSILHEHFILGTGRDLHHV